MGFAPGQVSQFAFLGHQYDVESQTLRLHYGLDQRQFEERIVFVGGRTKFTTEELAALDRCFFLTHLLAGVSYYKTAIPETIVVKGKSLSYAMAEFMNAVYANGLGEFAWTNGVTLHQRRFFVGADDRVSSSDSCDIDLAKQAVLPLGGGKDSLVSLELLRHRGIPLRTIAVGQSPLIKAVSDRSGFEHISIERYLDPQLFELNQQGAYNGHVPISAILAGIMLCGAVIYGYDTVLMSNEDSANVGNLVLADGFEVNHQYSKTLEFERAFADLIGTEVLAGFRYVSLLRPWSELAIARQFARSDRYDDVFSSCNRNFRVQAAASQRWCRDCPKCRFVFLALAPFLPRTRLLTIFGADLLADLNQRDGFLALLGLNGDKPFECVGEVGECRSALLALSGRPEWSGSSLLAELTDLLPADTPPLARWLKPGGRHRLSAELMELLDAAG